MEIFYMFLQNRNDDWISCAREGMKNSFHCGYRIDKWYQLFPRPNPTNSPPPRFHCSHLPNHHFS